MSKVKPKRVQIGFDDLKTEVVEMAGLSPHPMNPHIGDTDQIGKSIKAHGQFRAIVISQDNYILAGNHTFLSAVEQGKTKIAAHRLPLKHDSPQALEIMLADNKSHSGSEEDDYMLQQVLVEVQKQQGDLEGTLWQEDYLEKLIKEDAKKNQVSDPDDAPAKPKNPVCKPGQLWHLGQHRLMVGDCTDPKDMSRLMGTSMADLILTDPPYNADYSSRVDIDGKKFGGGIENDAQGALAYRSFLLNSFQAMDRYLQPGAQVYACIDYKSYPILEQVFEKFFAHKSTLVWDKGHFGLGKYYRTQYELLVWGWKGDKPAHWNAGGKERDVWHIEREDVAKYKHPTQKPVELIERALNNSSNKDHLVLDVFGGSGTTLIACERLGRICYTMEMDPGFADVICMRYQDQSDDKPYCVDTKEYHDFNP